MADTVIESAAVGEIEAVNTDERRNLLAEQLESVETTEAPVIEERPAERPRAADGKFAPKTEAKTEATPIAETPAEPPVWERAPQSWKKEVHEKWPTLDPQVRQYIHEREQQMRAGVEPARQKAVEYDKIAKAAEPFMGTIRGMGITLDRAVRGLMEADNILRTGAPEQKRGYLLQLAQQYGIQLGDVSQEPPVNHDVFALKNELAQIRGQLVAEQQAKEEAEQRTLLEQIQKFAITKEHFEDVRPSMVRLLQSGEAGDLEDAYKKAIRLNDDLFQAEQTALQAKAEAEKKATKDQAAKAARSAAVSVRSSTPGTHTASKAQDRRSMLAEQFGEQDGRL